MVQDKLMMDVKKKKVFSVGMGWKSLLFGLWAGGVFWVCSPLFVDEEVTPQWLWLVSGGSVWALLWAGGLFRGNAPARMMPETCVARIIALCAALLAAYALLQGAGFFAGRNGFPVVGRSDNPAGLASALALSAPFFLGGLRAGGCRMRALWGTGLLLVACGVAFSGSRAGMAALWTEGMLLAALRLRGRPRAAVLSLCLAAGMAAGVSLYFLKRASADGRLPIWRCTAGLVARRPLFGHGPGGFEAHYMDVQAGYFAAHPGSRFVLLADDVKHPFNEYLGLAADYGLAGLLALALGVAALLRLYRRGRGWADDCGLLCLAGWAVFAFFSYPSRYAHTWLLGGVAVWMLSRAAGWPGKGGRMARFLRRGAVRVSVAGAALAVMAGAAVRMDAEMRWRRAAYCAMREGAEAAFPEYERLMARLGRNPLFLYNYAAELNMAGHYGESLRIGALCEARFADYYTQLLQADNCLHTGRPSEAAGHALRAHHMCPGRLRPWLVRCEALRAAGDWEEACRVARAALRAPVKVESAETEYLRGELRRLLREMGQSSAISSHGSAFREKELGFLGKAPQLPVKT